MSLRSIQLSPGICVKSAVIWQNQLTPKFGISVFCIFSIVAPMSCLCANFEFALLTDFELFIVAKPINSIFVQKVVKSFKK